MSNGSISTFSKNSAELSLAAKRWSDLFFTHDIHIVGLTLDVCEIDLWWLLTYRAQLFHSNSGIKNEITLYSTKDRSSNEYAMQKVLFERLHVKVVSVPPEKDASGKTDYKEVAHFRSTSFFLIRKTDNQSTIIPCVRDGNIPREKENYNPVQYSYAAMWDEPKKLYHEDRASIAIKNVSRRIIDQYFLQLCGFDGADLRRIILEENKSKFVTVVANSKPNYEKYHLASSLLHYISSPSGIGDELYIDDEGMDSETHRTVFRLIFEAMHQDQHLQYDDV